MKNGPIIPEFSMYKRGLEQSEIEEISNRRAVESRQNKDRFMEFTDVLTEYVGSGEWKNHSDAFLSMIAKACFLRGMYGYNQILAKATSNLTCRGYAAAAYCTQSLDPRWTNNLRNYVNQAWQAKDYIAYAELSGQLASILIDLGYADHASKVASESIDKVTAETAKDDKIRTIVQAALLRPRVIMAYISSLSQSREEALIRLDSAEETAKLLDNRLALCDIDYYRARILRELREYQRAVGLVKSAHRKYERMGCLQGIIVAGNLLGVILTDTGSLQEARDQFEDLMIIQHQLNDQVGLANTLINVGEIDRNLGQLDQMEIYNRRALEISQEAEYVKGILISSVNLADVALRRGNYTDAKKLYSEAIEIAEKSGLKGLYTLTLFLAGDACFLTEEFDGAIKYYRKAKSISQENNLPLNAFNADVSELITVWSVESTDNVLLTHISTTMGDKDRWVSASDSTSMRDLRAKIFESPAIQSDGCIFYNGELNYECRVERVSLKKECFGNLFWKGSICPYFIDFVDSLSK
ncbi:MAG: tetratricopeptide repeat protein [Candidatus Thorarchaeota archaeon]